MSGKPEQAPSLPPQPQAPSSSPPPKKSSLPPSLFNNEYSRGPLWRAWRERSREDTATRARRVSDAIERSKGKNPERAEAGPISNTTLERRRRENEREGIVPGYEKVDSGVGEGREGPRQETGEEGLPAYVDTTAGEPGGEGVQGRSTGMGKQEGEFARSAREERERMEREGQEGEGGRGGRGVGKGEEEVLQKRKKSIAGKVGSWVGTALTGYNMKSDGERNENRW